MNFLYHIKISGNYSSEKRFRFICQSNMKCLLACLYLLLFTGVSVAGTARDNQIPLAVGEGIVITNEDLESLRLYMKKQKFTTSQEQFLQVMIRLTLFAAEAEKLNLHSGNAEISQNTDKLKKVILLSDLYKKNLQSAYQVSDLIVESYYFSHPEQFEQKGEGRKTVTDEETKIIKNIVRNAKSPEILQNAFEMLKKKYKVQVIEGNKQ